MNNPKFEYKIISVSTVHMKREKFQEELITKLNSLGNEGWELINVEGINGASILMNTSQTSELTLWFKRIKN